MKRLNVRLSEEDHRQLRVLAAMNGESIQALVERLLKKAAAEERSKPQ